MVWLPRPIGHRPSCAPPRPRSAMTDGHMQIRTRHDRAIGTNDHPAHPVTPSTFETPSIIRVRNCFLSAGRGTQTHRLPCYPGSPPVRRHGGEPGHTLRTHVDGGSHIRTIKTGPKEPHDGSTGRLALFGTFRVDHCPSFLHAPSARSSHTLIPVFTPRRLWASWACR